MKNKLEVIEDDIRRSFLDLIYKRIQKKKSTLVIGKIGSGKTKFLKQIAPKKTTISNVESLGSLNYILVSILQQQKYNFPPKINRSVEYLQSICDIKNLVIIIDDIKDLRMHIFRYIKRIIDAQIPVIMAGPPEMQSILQEQHEDIFCRLKVLNLQTIGVENYKKLLPQFDNDAIDFIFGHAFGNMWVFNEICDECLDEIARLKQKKVSVDIVEKLLKQV